MKHKEIWLEPDPISDDDFGRMWHHKNVWGSEAWSYVLRGDEKWQPIETCRKNESVITCAWWKSQPHRPFIQEGYLDWDGERWWRQSGEAWKEDLTKPTHWMPLPSPPKR